MYDNDSENAYKAPENIKTSGWSIDDIINNIQKFHMADSNEDKANALLDGYKCMIGIVEDLCKDAKGNKKAFSESLKSFQDNFNKESRKRFMHLPEIRAQALETAELFDKNVIEIIKFANPDNVLGQLGTGFIEFFKACLNFLGIEINNNELSKQLKEISEQSPEAKAKSFREKLVLDRKNMTGSRKADF